MTSHSKPSIAIRSPLVHPPETARDGGHHLVVLRPAVLELEDVLGLDVATPVEVDGRLLGGFGRIDGEQPPHQPLLVGNPQLRPVRFGEPSGVADMVRVEVGHDRAVDRLAATELPDDPLPVPLHLRAGDAGIQHRPTVAVPEKPQIDVVEGEGERHPHPEDPVLDLECVSSVADGFERMVYRRRGHERTPCTGASPDRTGSGEPPVPGLFRVAVCAPATRARLRPSDGTTHRHRPRGQAKKRAGRVPQRP